MVEGLVPQLWSWMLTMFGVTNTTDLVHFTLYRIINILDMKNEISLQA